LYVHISFPWPFNFLQSTYIYFILTIPFTNSFIAPAPYNIRTFQFALLMSLILFHCLGRFHSVCSEATVRFPKRQLFSGDRFSASRPASNLEGQSAVFITTLRVAYYTPDTGYTFWSPFTTCTDCSEAVLLRSQDGDLKKFSYI